MNNLQMQGLYVNQTDHVCTLYFYFNLAITLSLFLSLSLSPCLSLSVSLLSLFYPHTHEMCEDFHTKEQSNLLKANNKGIYFTETESKNQGSEV